MDGEGGGVAAEAEPGCMAAWLDLNRQFGRGRSSFRFSLLFRLLLNSNTLPVSYERACWQGEGAQPGAVAGNSRQGEGQARRKDNGSQIVEKSHVIKVLAATELYLEDTHTHTPTRVQTVTLDCSCYQHLYCIYLLVFYYLANAHSALSLYTLSEAEKTSRASPALRSAPGINIYLFILLFLLLSIILIPVRWYVFSFFFDFAAGAFVLRQSESS